MGKTASPKQCQGVNAKHSVTLLRACHSANLHCSITSCTLLSRLQKSFYFKCMFKSFPRRALGGWSGEGKAGEESRGWIMEERYKCYVFLLPFYSMAGSLHHFASCRTCCTGSAECPITEGPLAQSMCRGAVRMQASWKRHRWASENYSSSLALRHSAIWIHNLQRDM